MSIANLEEYSQLEELPFRFKHVADKGHLKHTPASQEQLQQIEREALLSAFSFQKFCGGYSIVKYLLPDSINVKTMAKILPLTGDEELVKFVQSVQLCVEAYHDRKQQILLAKDILRSKELKFFNSIDYMFVVLTLKMPNKVKEFIPVDISLIYESNKVRPSSIEPKCKDIDKETLSSIKEEFNILKTQSLDEGLHILFSKQESGSDTSSFSKISSVNEEPEQHNFINETRSGGLNLSSDSRRNIRNSSQKGQNLRSRRSLSSETRSGGLNLSSDSRRNIGNSSQKGPNLRSRRSLSRSPTKAVILKSEVHKLSSPERRGRMNRSPIKDTAFKSEKVARKKKEDADIKSKKNPSHGAKGAGLKSRTVTYKSSESKWMMLRSSSKKNA